MSDEDFDRPLAMKVMLRGNADFEDRFLREARLTGVLQHPGIPPVHALGRLDVRTVADAAAPTLTV